MQYKSATSTSKGLIYSQTPWTLNMADTYLNEINYFYKSDSNYIMFKLYTIESIKLN